MSARDVKMYKSSTYFNIPACLPPQKEDFWLSYGLSRMAETFLLQRIYRTRKLIHIK